MPAHRSSILPATNSASLRVRANEISAGKSFWCLGQPGMPVWTSQVDDSGVIGSDPQRSGLGPPACESSCGTRPDFGRAETHPQRTSAYQYTELGRPCQRCSRTNTNDAALVAFTERMDKRGLGPAPCGRDISAAGPCCFKSLVDPRNEQDVPQSGLNGRCPREQSLGEAVAQRVARPISSIVPGSLNKSRTRLILLRSPEVRSSQVSVPSKLPPCLVVHLAVHARIPIDTQRQDLKSRRVRRTVRRN